MIKLEKYDNLKSYKELPLGAACVVWKTAAGVYASPATIAVAGWKRVVYYAIPNYAKILGYCDHVENGIAVN